MTQKKFCQSCKQLNNCQEIYQQSGSTKGSSVVLKVVIAFLLPIIVFIAALAVFERILAGSINNKAVLTAVSFFLAATVAFLVVIGYSWLTRVAGGRKD